MEELKLCLSSTMLYEKSTCFKQEYKFLFTTLLEMDISKKKILKTTSLN